MDIAREVRILLAKENLKVSDLARRLDTSHQNISNILSKNNLTINKIEDIANALGYEIDIIFKKKDQS